MGNKTLTERFTILRPWLLKDDWAAMTYMLIPHVLKEAEQLRIDLVSAPDPETKTERQRLLRELKKLMHERSEWVATARRFRKNSRNGCRRRDLLRKPLAKAACIAAGPAALWPTAKRP
ncbi:MAG: hypothetical protein OHK0011_14980 [Turneriella sp.]